MPLHDVDDVPICAGHPGLTDHERQVVRNAAARIAGQGAVYELRHPGRSSSPKTGASAT